jgi:hypothetical protein
VTVTPVGPLSGKEAVGNLTPSAFNTATLFTVALAVDKATGLSGIFHVND